MYGSATLAMVWSSACISVAPQVQRVMINRCGTGSGGVMAMRSGGLCGADAGRCGTGGTGALPRCGRACPYRIHERCDPLLWPAANFAPSVMAGLVPAIHDCADRSRNPADLAIGVAGGRDKPGHDGGELR